jgi:putative redox protein
LRVRDGNAKAQRRQGRAKILVFFTDNWQLFTRNSQLITMLSEPISPLPMPMSPQLPRLITGPVDPSGYGTAARLYTETAISGMAFVAETPTLHHVTLDVHPNFGGASAGPEPLDLLLISLGSCTGMDVISILRKKRQAVTHYTVNVFANGAQQHPKVFTDILVEHVVEGHNVDPRAVKRSIELSITKYCPVHVMLSHVVHIEHVYRVVEG